MAQFSSGIHPCHSQRQIDDGFQNTLVKLHFDPLTLSINNKVLRTQGAAKSTAGSQERSVPMHSAALWLHYLFLLPRV